MAITAALVKELRERTGAGMMDCKKALTETGGDIEAAVDQMRKSGALKADKKAGRVAAEGAVAIAEGDGSAAIVEVNCETDFVARGDAFADFTSAIARTVLEAKPATIDELAACPMAGKTVDEARRDLIASLGENIQVRRFGVQQGGTLLGKYIHTNNKIGVVVALEGGDAELARDVAMHIAWNNPPYLSPDDVPADQVSREKEIFVEQARGEGKPDAIIDKIVSGKLRKFLDSISLLGQPFVKDDKSSVGKLLGAAEASVVGYVRLEVGEGIEKKQEDFAAEVMAQVRGDD
ncbi:MAG: elongation factor Ts [Gammaproteobacteria bacterium]|nr:elongation factor Ts [Gammaproteobacteria bacterium]NNM21291.1 elongation factor Ts [Gammaproteobacteria bacterium]